ncbi:MAG: tetratricopeptide repeat protein, partial [Deltaproteobacteria bacterium]|nr:tetratricopeptide repeat protein [Deltaproteobacteria bacterium]
LGHVLLLSRLTIDQRHQLQTAGQKREKASKLEQAQNFDQAVPLMEQVVSVRRNIYGSDYFLMAADLNLLGDFYDLSSNPDEAVSAYGQALDIRKKVLGETHPDTAGSVEGLGLMLA